MATWLAAQWPLMLVLLVGAVVFIWALVLRSRLADATASQASKQADTDAAAAATKAAASDAALAKLDGKAASARIKAYGGVSKTAEAEKQVDSMTDSQVETDLGAKGLK